MSEEEGKRGQNRYKMKKKAKRVLKYEIKYFSIIWNEWKDIDWGCEG